MHNNLNKYKKNQTICNFLRLLKCLLEPVVLYLQYEDEIIDWLVALEEVVLWWSLVFLIKLEFLHHARVLYQPQEDLLWEMRRLKRLYFYRK